ncbi:MAG TPA: formate dehydrogenase accessory sulfurtransferase FdhD [Lactobacillus acetotolerans]|nr:formate dehydrogenase accessory sulfurtransferase FdhD [Lactobacillus acetotolerans]
MKKTMELHIVKYDKECKKTVEESTICEYPLNVFVNGEHLTVLLCTPDKLRELTIGFLAFKGIIKSLDEIKSLEIDEKSGVSRVTLKNSQFNKKLYSNQILPATFNENEKSKFFSYIIDSMKISLINNDNVYIHVDKIYDLMMDNLGYSKTFKLTGGAHCAALCDEDKVISICEDVARHNAVDKLIGEAFIKNIYLKDKIIFVSSRVSFEMVYKIARLGVPIIISKSAPTNLSIEFAKALNVTLIGFVRGERMNIYTNPQRII